MPGKVKHIVVFASGNGSNALNLIQCFNSGEKARVVAVFSNKKDAGVVQKAIDNQVDVCCFDRPGFYHSTRVIDWVGTYRPDIIVLAGFLWLVPIEFIRAFEGKIINLHPSLLPKFGGKGMYGHHVHNAVLEAGEKETGITIHKVDEEYDKGDIICQKKFEIFPEDNLNSIETKIHMLEQEFLPLTVQQFLKI
jgi:phosphoribosylglycinamide formyltransferase-1